MNNLSLHYDSIKTYSFGDTLDWSTSKPKVIGTLGADLIEKMKLIIDFKNGQVALFKHTPDSLLHHPLLTDFDFEERRVMINVSLDGNKKKLMWDTGASAYDLITSKDEWETMALNPNSVKPEETNQLSRKLKVYTAKSNQTLYIGKAKLPLNTVTYIEGFPWYIEMAFSFSGMEGMIGNNLFRGRRIFIDAENEKFILF